MVEMGKSKSVGVWSFMSMSPKLAWMNTAVALVTLEGDPSWMEFDVAIWEWKSNKNENLTGFPIFSFFMIPNRLFVKDLLGALCHCCFVVHVENSDALTHFFTLKRKNTTM